ncbi:MAG TPA: LysR family transcriptional regulator [Spirochaetota bacterium]|nr:LysR family transcriptional regulator [Spirochaetota bacterium]
MEHIRMEIHCHEKAQFRPQTAPPILVVVEHRSFTLASRALRVGQAAMSNRVSALEETPGIELIRRSSRVLALTPQGGIFKTFCERHFDEIGPLRKEISDAVAAGVTVVASSIIPSAYVLPALI